MNAEYFKKEIEYSKQYLHDIERLSCPDDDVGAKKAGIDNLLESIKYVEYGLVANPKLILDLISPESASLGKETQFSFLNDRLDDTQKLAVKKATSMNNILLIQGPPGAGKSTTIVEIIRQIKNKEPKCKIIVSSQTHVAVDNVLEKLLKSGYDNIVRVAAKSETNELLKDYYLSSIFQNYKDSCNEELRNHLNDFNREVKKIIDEKEETVVTNELITRQARSILLSRDVIGITANALKSAKFSVADGIDYAIVDEVGKMTFAELLFVMRFVNKIILIGDPKQLPAVLENFDLSSDFNKEAYNHLQKEPFINYLFEHINPACKVFLNKQYRMAKQIGNYISDCFYTYKDNKLQNGVSTVSNENALNFIDYDANKYIVSGSDEQGTDLPLSNPYEVEIIKSLLNELKNRGVDINHDVALISPYRGQIRLIKEAFPNIIRENIDTVDAFQGRENKVVIFSCSRNKNVTMFFKKPNRINVAISRAISEVWVIGSKEFCLQVEHLKKYYYYNSDAENLNSRCNHYYFDGNEIKKTQP